jgi:4-amino-4-deoxy-L-arabinose transferase-like glycosyltransferase
MSRPHAFDHYTGDLSRSWLIIPLLFFYLFKLGSVGFLGPDEPRYASIGREMAISHDFVTPRLDGQPWFEKPPLLYWMTAAGTILGLHDEWAARLPVELLSILFLIFFFNVLSREFSPRIATYASIILATSTGWIAYSFVAVTDLAMSVLLSAALLIAMFDTRRNSGYIAGALLGLSILAKGFVPLILFAPLFLIVRRRRLTTMAGAILVAAPWYLLCFERNGYVFWEDFFWRQQFERFFTPLLQHVQPMWFYIPILLAALFPWTILAGVLFRRKTYDDVRIRFLAGWLIYGLVFFSVARNKLPGYVLPLLPALTIVLAVGLSRAGVFEKWWIAICALMLVALPMIAAALPQALLEGLSKAPLIWIPGLPFLALAPVVWYLAWREKPILAVLAIGLAVVVGITYLKRTTFPVLDQRVSVRGFWRDHSEEVQRSCTAPFIKRDWLYGLNYYAGRPMPTCQPGQVPRIEGEQGHLAIRR